MKGETFSADRMAEEFLAYLFKNRANDRHVRRVASWLGLLILGVDKVKDRWWVSHIRQLCFECHGRRFKVKFDHEPRPRGGIHFVEIEPNRGQRELRTILIVTNLDEAATFFAKPSLG
jgi:hypothetical protein